MGLVSRNSNLSAVIVAAAFLMSAVPVWADQVTTDVGPLADQRFVVRVLGPDRRPVAGAKVGTGVNFFEDSQGHPPQTITMWLRGRRRDWPFVSNARGEIQLAGSDTEHEQFFASLEGRGWVGYLRMRDDMSGGRADIVMEPACRAHGQIVSAGLERLALFPYKTTALVYDSQDTLVMYFVSDRGRYEFLLPSGSYKIEYVAEGPGGVESKRLRRDLVIARGQHEADLGLVDLKESPLARLLGKTAPELGSVHSWNGGEPIELKDLKGQIVVLVFWASWSEASLKTMPRLIELHDLYQDEGLAIVAVHDNSVRTKWELDANLTEARLRYWGRRELPFVVGLDRGPGPGTTHGLYGIEEWPTTIVIGRDGNVAGLFHPWGELQQEVPKLLAQIDQSEAYTKNTASMRAK